MRNGSGCPDCAIGGFKASKEAWFYLMQSEGEQQLGITNDLHQRLSYHSCFGWSELDSTGPYLGQKVLDTEILLKIVKRKNWTYPRNYGKLVHLQNGSSFTR